MQNIFIRNLNKKDVEHFTTNIGLFLRRKLNFPFKKACNIFTNVHIIREPQENKNNEEYFSTLSEERIPLSKYELHPKKHNIIIERYPSLPKDEPYIFVCNHTCPEDIETVLNIIDRNAYLVLGSLETLRYDPEMYLSWLNGMIPFDILDSTERKELIPKMARVLKTNSILIFPEGSHNYNPNKLVNNLFDGPINLSLQTNRKIVVISYIRDNENNVSYIDVSNPIDFSKVEVEIPSSIPEEEHKKYKIKSMSKSLRDYMATAVYHIIERHFDRVSRIEGQNIESELRTKKIEDSFAKMKWNKDIFEAEFLTKKTSEEKTHEEVTRTLSNLRLNMESLRNGLHHRNYVLQELDLDSKDVVLCMRRHFLKLKSEEEQKKLTKRI